MKKNDREFEIDRPHHAGRLYKYLIDYKFFNATLGLPFPVKDLTILDACCGSGMISEYYAKCGAKVTGVDLSEESIKRAKIRKERYNFNSEFKVGDVTNLSFPDNSFDIVSVHDGLHHLSEPWKAVREMVRITKKGVVIIEPAKSLITKISVWLGISTNYEGKDFVYRFKENEIASWLKGTGIKKVISKRYIMYYPHKPGVVFKFLGLPVIFTIVKFGFYLINVFLGRFGNKIQVIGLK